MNIITTHLNRLLILFVTCCLFVVTSIAISSAGTDDGALVSPIPLNNINSDTSHRLIVQLESPSLAEWLTAASTTRSATRIDTTSQPAQAYLSALEAEQATFIASLSTVLPTAKTTGYINESGREIPAAYQIVANAVAIDPGTADIESARRTLSGLSGVKAVYRDYAHYPTTYTSTHLIDAPALWDTFSSPADAGRGVKVASVDGGLHHAAEMFDGTNFDYPSNYPEGGLGDQSNNNGKIIASRAYFRSWDPPAPGDENSWAGENGISHGVHTASTAAGNRVTANYLGTDIPGVSGVAPGAWLMSYRVFYASTNDIVSFYSIEGIAALEDAVADGADVINNSWGGGPSGAGGEFNLLDTALSNAEAMDVFVSMSAGNAGPGQGTTDHPSDVYMNVGATTSGGKFTTGELNVTSTMSETLQDLAYSTGNFGLQLELGQAYAYSVIPSATVDPANTKGCAEWEGVSFVGHAVLIPHGSCQFSDKIYYAQEAGAEFVIIHSNTSDSLINMRCGNFCDEIVITAIFIGQTNGEAMVSSYESDGVVEIELNTLAQQAGNVADTVADFSSRGPSVGSVLKPDIVAPGMNILAQGYANAEGEDRHLGYGEANGTSMAAPHVAGAAALIRALHPNWSNDMIKSAMMSTAKYMDIYNKDGSPAQPLDIGAGRLRLTDVKDVNLMFDPPSLSFSDMMTGSSKTIAVNVMNVGDSAAVYDVTTEFTGMGFMTVTTIAGMSVSPEKVILASGESTMLEVTFDSTMGLMGNNQGYIVLTSDNTSNDMKLSMPAWARVNPTPPAADILVIDNDFSDLLGHPDYTAYYTQTVQNLGHTYDYYNADANYGNPTTLPPVEQLIGYKSLILYTGDHYETDAQTTLDYDISTPLTDLDMDILTEYANSGGFIIVMGQDASSSMGGTDGSDNNAFFFDYILGGDEDILQDSVSDFSAPDNVIVSYANELPALRGVTIDLSAPTVDTVILSPLAEVPPANSTTSGSADITYDATNMILSYNITITPDTSEPITVTAAHIHTGILGTNGSVLYNIFPFTQTQYVTDSLSFSGSTMLITTTHEAALLAGELYFNVHTEQNPGGEIRAQISATPSGDGAGNQIFVDELDPFYGKPESEGDVSGDEIPGLGSAFMPILRYPDPTNIDEGTVAMAHRDQPSLERPGITYFGRSIFAAFGLEGVNNGTGHASREDVLGAFLAWGMDEPTATITQTQLTDTLLQFDVSISSNITGTTGWMYRWDFGDGSPIYGPLVTTSVAHEYSTCPTNPVRVEAIDSWGNVTVEALDPADIICNIVASTSPIMTPTPPIITPTPPTVAPTPPITPTNEQYYYLPMVMAMP